MALPARLEYAAEEKIKKASTAPGNLRDLRRGEKLLWKPLLSCPSFLPSIREGKTTEGHKIWRGGVKGGISPELVHSPMFAAGERSWTLWNQREGGKGPS